MKLIHKLLFTVGLFVSCATLAQAHAFLDHAEPKVGSTLKVPPSAVKIWFTEELDAPSCNLQIFNAAGMEIDKKDVKIEPVQKILMSVSVTKLVRLARTKWCGTPAAPVAVTIIPTAPSPLRSRGRDWGQSEFGISPRRGAGN